MARIIRISASQNWLTGGGKLQFPLDFLPVGHRITAAHLEAAITIDVPAAGFTADQQTALVTGIEQERRLRTTGLGESAIDWSIQGKDTVRPAALTTGNGQVVSLFWPLAFSDPRNIQGNDHAPATAFLRGKTLDVYLAKAADIVAATVVQSGTVQLVCFLEPLPEGVVPASIVKGYVEVIGKETRLPAGRYTDLVMVKNDGTTITEAELGNIQLTMDGSTNLLERARTPQLARQFNYFRSKGTTQQAASAEGEALPNSGALPMVPFISTEDGYKATKLANVRQQLVLTFDGTLAANVARLFYRYIEPRTAEATIKGAVKLGYKVGAKSIVDPKTASKKGVPEGARYEDSAGIMAARITEAD